MNISEMSRRGVAEAADFEARIGVIGAMEVEVNAICELLENRQSVRIGAYTYNIGNIGGVSAVVARCGVGKVNAAICAATMILTFAPQTVINTGVAGALAEELDVGDVVIADSAVEHDMDYGTLGDERGQIFFPDGRSETYFAADGETAGALAAAAESLGLHTLRGIVASGDIFVCTDEKRREIKTLFRADACEMEGAAIAHACRIYGVPFAILRSVSDRANGNSNTDFPAFTRLAAARATAVVASFARSLSQNVADGASREA